MERYKNILYYMILLFLILLLTYAMIKLYPVYIILLKFIGKLFLPFIIAAFISYLIHPLLKKMKRWNINKVIAILLIFLLFIGIFLFIFYRSLPMFINELEELSEQLPHLIESYEGMIYSLYQSTAFLPETVHDKMDILISTVETRLDMKITLLMEKLVNITDFIILIAIIPVLVFYFLKDYELIFHWLKGLLKENTQKKYARMVKAFDDSLGDYIRGQLIISLTITTITYAVYHVLELKYALLLAIFMGVMNVIPYFGPIIGSVPAIAISMTVSVKVVIIIIITNSIIQLLESSFLSPYIMGKSVKIHPIVLIFVLLAGAEIGGIIGMIVAVPSVTVFRGLYEQYKIEKQHSN